MTSHRFASFTRRWARAVVALSLLLVGLPQAAVAAEGRWRLNHLEVQKPTADQLGKNCSYKGDGGRNANIGGGNFETKCFSPALNVTDVRAGNMGWSYVTSGHTPPPAGIFNEGLDLLIPGQLIGFVVDAAATTARSTVSGQVLMRTTHPQSGLLTVVATPYTSPNGKATAKGYGKILGQPRPLADGRLPQLVLTFAVVGSHSSQGIQVHLFYDWIEDAAKPPPPPRPATTSPAPPPPPATATKSASPLLGCFKDDRWNRDLSGFTYNEPGMTTQACVSACAQRGFRYAATQYSTHCFCDNAYGKHGQGTQCNMPCGGNKAEMCGGYSVNSVYATGR